MPSERSTVQQRVKVLGPEERYVVKTSSGSVTITAEKETPDGLVLEDENGALWQAENFDRWHNHLAVGEIGPNDGPDDKWWEKVV